MHVAVRHTLAWLVALAISLLTTLAAAQPVSTTPISPGFEAFSAERTFDSEVDARLFTDVDGERCHGFIGSRPLLSFEATEPIEATLRLNEAYSGSIVVQSASGVYCTGPPESGAAITRTWEPGRYSLFVGLPTVQWGARTIVELFEPAVGWREEGHLEARTDDELTLAELETLVREHEESPFRRSYGATDDLEAIVGTGEGGAITRLLSTSFRIDDEPYFGSAELTGSWQAVLPVTDIMSFWGLEACPGSVGAGPEHTLEIPWDVVEGVRLVAEEPHDIVVLVDGPDALGEGHLRCATPGEGGLLIDLGREAGVYQLWVGGQSGASGEYRLRFEVDAEAP